MIIPGTHNRHGCHACRDSGRSARIFGNGAAFKMLIDATIPPPADAIARAQFERIRPHNPHLRLEVFAAKDSLPLVRALAPDFLVLRLLARAKPYVFWHGPCRSPGCERGTDRI